MTRTLYTAALVITTSLSGCTQQIQNRDTEKCVNLTSKEPQKEIVDSVLTYKVNPSEQELKFYWKDSSDNAYYNYSTLKDHLAHEGKELIFAMNGGIFTKDHQPLGLYIENGQVLKPVNKIQSAYGNFYLQPNGIFYITNDKKAFVTTSDQFKLSKSIQYATQSGPMLVIDGKIHSKFTKGSDNLNIKNGVGILPNGNILFAMSTEKVSLYDFASYFKKAGCKNALYLDGAISETYLPEKEYNNPKGTFIIMIGVTE